MTDVDRPPDKTPWGHKDFEDERIPGFTMVITSGHGGLYLTAKQREDIPEALNQYSNDGKGMWWEEDCAWSLPIVYLLSKRPQASLSADEKEFLAHAHVIARDYYPDTWENLTGRKIKPGQSEERDRETFLLQRKDNLIVGTGWGSSRYAPWVPKGMVGVAAYPAKAFLGPRPDPARTHDARFFLVPEKEYNSRFVVDPARHQEVTGKDGVPPSKCEDKIALAKKQQDTRLEDARNVRDALKNRQPHPAKDSDRER